MTAQMLEGGPIAEKIKEEVRAAVAAMASPPKLAAVLASGLVPSDSVGKEGKSRTRPALSDSCITAEFAGEQATT